MKKKNDLDVFNSLYIYGNEEKLDALLSQIYTSVISQFEIQTKKGKSIGGKFKGGLNKIFSKFGLPEIEVEFQGNIEHENIKSVVSSITFDSKVDILISYYKMNGRYPCIDLLHGDNYEYLNNKKVNKEKFFEGSLVGVVIGKFAAKRIYPSVESVISLADDIKSFEFDRTNFVPSRIIGIRNSQKVTIFKDFSDKSNNLWNLYTVRCNAIQGEIPILIGNIRTVSQYGLLKLYKQSEYLVEAIGVLSWENDMVVCDPIAFKLL